MSRTTVHNTPCLRLATSAATAAATRRGVSNAMLGAAPGKNNAGATIAVITAGVSLWIFLRVTDKPSSTPAQTLPELLDGIRHVLVSRHFWRFASIAFAQIGGFMAVQSLWCSAWLIHVNGYSRSEAADHIAAMSAAMVVAYFLIGLLSARLARRGIGTTTLLGGGQSLALLTLFLIIIQATEQHYLLWIAYGTFSCTGTLNYAATAAGFPVSLSGRANTILNLLAFLGAFSLQWGMGALIESLGAAGNSPVIAHRNAFIVLFVIQAASLIWFFVRGHRFKPAP